MIAGAGFVVMAWQLACRRTKNEWLLRCGDWPQARERAQGVHPASREYYCILDKAAACFDHRNATFMSGTVTGPYRCVL